MCILVQACFARELSSCGAPLCENSEDSWNVRRLPGAEKVIDPTLLYVLCIVFIATVIRSAFGFGEALVAVPLLAFRIPLQLAAPLAVLLSIIVAAIVVVQDWKDIHLRSAGGLVLSSVLGIPFGVLLLKSSHYRTTKGALGVFLILFCVYSLIGRTPLHLRSDDGRWLGLCGFASGVLGGAYGMNGPPLVIYGTMRGWSPQHFRATLQGYFLPASIMGIAGYRLAGLWTPILIRYFLFALPVTLLGVFLGRVVNHQLHSTLFYKYLYLGLAGIGALLVFQAIRGGF